MAGLVFMLRKIISGKVYSERKKLQDPFSASALHSQMNKKRIKKCLFCDQDDHLANWCKSVTNADARKKILLKKGRCFICLGQGHMGKDCPSKYSCMKCKRRHHISICAADQEKASVPQETHTHFVSASSGVLLKTALASISDTSFSHNCDTRVLFDGGSQASYISTNLCKTLKLKHLRSERILIYPFGENVAKVYNSKVHLVNVKHRERNDFRTIEVYSVPYVCRPLTSQNIEYVKANYSHIEGLELADDNVDGGSLEVGLLIGSDFDEEFYTGVRRKGFEGPTARETILGWVLGGKFNSSNDQNQHSLQVQHVLKAAVVRSDDKIASELSKFWEIESTGTKEASVIDDFKNHIFHDGSRYVTQLPFKPDHDTLPDNFSVSQRRLKSTIKKLKSSGIYDDYHEIFKEYEKEDIIEKVPPGEVYKESGTVHYLPHRAVVREDKVTTKIRPVFDASCKVNGPSLNECLYSGPNLLCKIFDVLFRFRLNKIGVVADIRKAFLNISVAPKHQDFLRFIWEENDEQVIYRFRRLVMGLTCSPFLLNGTVQQHINKLSGKYPTKILKKLEKDLYVDDITSGCESLEEGRQFQKVAMSLMKDAGLDLRKWKTNDKELQQIFDSGKVCEKTIGGDDSTFAKTQYGDVKENGYHKVLGLEWDIESDCFVFDFKDFLVKAKNFKLTKRNILSLSASIYDPLGIISPITAQIKTLFQCLCVDKSGWDDLISDLVRDKWIAFLEKIEALNAIRIPRFSFVALNKVLLVELHGFSDSSESLYCAVVYVRIVTVDGVKVFFWTSKTKVAPLKSLSIPRLELLGCLLLTDLLVDVRRALCDRIKINRTVCWTDSMVALCWIRGKEKAWKPWVENRVVKIREVVSRNCWFHIAGVENPADKPTRSVEDFGSLFDGDWFSGPSFLLSSDIFYSNAENSLPTEAKQEMKSSTDVLNVLTVTEQKVFSLNEIVDFTRFSSLSKLINTIAYIIRFKNNLLAKIRHNTDLNYDSLPSIEETNNALDLVIRTEQNEMKRHVDFKKTKANLNIYEDDSGVLRLKSRFGESQLSSDEKNPIMLNEKSWLTTLIIRKAHEEVLHFGVETTLAKIREKFWIVRGRKITKNVLRKCVICKRYQGKTMKPTKETNLPEFRVNVMSHAFATTGLDYAGPLFVKNKGLPSSKVYILLFTCASSRAIHLELTPDMKSHAFIRGFKRFTSRRGTPNEIISDNFKTFKSVEVKSFMLNSNIRQRYILPASPWWGGFYERLVRSVKTSLRKILKRSSVTFEELQTILCEIEFTINSRPLCYGSDDDIHTTITPNHLIYGRNLTNSTSQDIQEVDPAECTRRSIYIRTVVNNFWKSFSCTYLNELKQKHIYERKRKTGSGCLKQDDVVLIKDDTPAPRAKWKIGKVEELIVGKDGNVRGAKLKVNTDSGGTAFAHRPIQKLIPFEIQAEESNHSTENQESSGVARDEPHVESRVRRRAAVEGQALRRLRMMNSR